MNSFDEPGKGKLDDKSDEGVLAEWHYWNDKIKNATGWGAALTAADAFRRNAAVRLRLRGLCPNCGGPLNNHEGAAFNNCPVKD